MTAASDRLTAFYDFEVCPATFDFADFLALAELARRRHAARALHIVIVPARGGGFRSDDSTFDENDKRWRLYNILLSSCTLLPQFAGLTVCQSRIHAEDVEQSLEGPVFPEGYSTERPRADFMLSGIVAAAVQGEEIPKFRATARAAAYAGRWIEQCSGGRRTISITLREATHEPSRNSNLAAWSAFAKRLDPALYCPVFVRDTERAFDPVPPALAEFLLCPFAPVNLDLRIALYEKCWLNLMMPNGPGVICWLDDHVRLLMFKMITEGADNASELYVASQGLKIGGQAPFATPFQRMVWEPDTLDVIEREFAAMIERIGDAAAIADPSPDPANAEDPMVVAVRLQSTGRLEEATAIYQQIVTREPANADAWHMLGIIAHQAERPDAAERMILHAIRIDPRRANFFVNLSAVLRKLERPEEALNALWRAITLAPGDAGAHADLAELLHAQGENDKAKAALLKAIQLKPESEALCERAARVLHALGHVEQAADLYRRALDLRDDRRKRAAQMRESMPEIPVVTLKTA